MVARPTSRHFVLFSSESSEMRDETRDEIATSEKQEDKEQPAAVVGSEALVIFHFICVLI